MSLHYYPSTYSAEAVDIGIVHIGLGAFVRAHIAVYLEKLLQLDPGPWGICAANIRSNQKIVDALNEQNAVYTVAEYASQDQVALRQIRSVREVLFAGHGKIETLLQRMTHPKTKIVSLTVTEKGYFFDAAKQQLRLDAAQIQQDLLCPDTAQTAPGILLAALRQHYLQGSTPFTVLSCDNMPHNGQVLRNTVIQMAQQSDTELAQWISENVSFPSTMVDRIVPAVTEKTVDNINALLQKTKVQICDQAPIATERFSQWVIEDHFPNGRPALEKVGVLLVDEVAPWEEMKLRLLNGSHSLLAYIGYLLGYATVDQCMQDAQLKQLIKSYMQEEAVPTLNMPSDVDLGDYIQQLLTRFSNDSLQHKTLQIAMDGSQKLPQRWCAGSLALFQKNNSPNVVALGFAAWIFFLRGGQDTAEQHTIDDPLADSLHALAMEQNSATDKVRALFNLPLFSQFSFNQYAEFTQAVAQHYQCIATQGMAQALTKCLSNKTVRV